MQVSVGGGQDDGDKCVTAACLKIEARMAIKRNEHTETNLYKRHDDPKTQSLINSSYPMR